MVNHGKRSQPGVPHCGWTCEGVEDLGEPDAICEMCERQTIRYVHYMTHPAYPGTLGCGCVCAGRMGEDYEAARRREQKAKNRAARILSRTEELREASDLYARWLKGDEPDAILDLLHGRLTKTRDKAQGDDHPDQAQFEALLRDVEQALSEAEAQRKAEAALAQLKAEAARAEGERVAFGARWRVCRGNPVWEMRQSGGRQLRFEGHRAWVYQGEDDRYRAGFQLQGREVTWVHTNYPDWERAAEAALFRMEQELFKAGLMPSGSLGDQAARP